MKILFSGCSFTYGYELDNPEKERYSHFVGKRFDAEDINVSDCGASAHMVVFHLMNHIERYGKPDAVVVQWPPYIRSELWNSHWDRKMASMAPQDYLIHWDALDHQKHSKYYFENIHNDAIAFDRWFMQMYAMENVMRQMDLPYVTISVDKGVWDCPAYDNLAYHPIYGPYVQETPAAIYGDILPQVRINTAEEFKDRWCKPGGHPNEQAHRLIAHHVIRKLKEVVV